MNKEDTEVRRSSRLRGNDPSFHPEDLSELNRMDTTSNDRPPVQEIQLLSEKVSSNEFEIPQKVLDSTLSDTSTPRKYRSNENKVSETPPKVLESNLQDEIDETMSFLDQPLIKKSWKTKSTSESTKNIKEVTEKSMAQQADDFASLQENSGSSDTNISYDTENIKNKEQQGIEMIKTYVKETIFDAFNSFEDRFVAMRRQILQEQKAVNDEYTTALQALTEKVNKQQFYLETLVKNHHKFAKKSAEIIENVNEVTEEVHTLQDKVKNGVQPNYLRLNLICDRIEDIKNDLEHNNVRDIILEVTHLKKNLKNFRKQQISSIAQT